MVDKLREVWPRLSLDEKKLFDVIARAYLASVMRDFRYRQTTVTLDVKGFAFRAAGRQPIDLGWRAAFPDWRPAEEKGDEAQTLPALQNGEIAGLRAPKIEAKETRPPPRYNEGSLIEAMQNAWRFVDDELLRERLKEAKGIGTPATRADIIGGLKKQAFLMIDGKHIVPTEIGLSLFAVLEKADPALVDPGATAQLEYLLDDVVLGKQEMVGAIDAVCNVAQRIIGKLIEGGANGGTLPRGGSNGAISGGYPPTPAMKRYADSLARQKRLRLPTGYDTSISICRAFLYEHAAGKADGEARQPEVAARTRTSLKERKDAEVADSGKVNLIAKLAPLKAKQGAPHTRRGRKGTDEMAGAPAATKKRQTSKNKGRSSPTTGAGRSDAVSTTPLRIPYGNKEIARKLGARYGSNGWYAPPGIDLSAFRERGWT
jgi:DNA topoisomerase-3